MKALADKLEVWGFESGFVIFSDGSLGFGLELSPLDVTCFNDERLDSLAGRISSFLNNLPEGLDLQFIQEVTRDNGGLFKKSQNLVSSGLPVTISELHSRRLSWLSEKSANDELPKHSIKLFVRKTFGSLVEGAKLFSRPKRFERISEEKLQREIDLTSQLKKEMMGSLESLGMLPFPISERETAELIYDQWNPGRDVSLKNYNQEDIRSSLLFTDLSVYDLGFSMSDTHHRVVSLKILPDMTYSTMARALSELPFDSRLFLTIHIPYQHKELEVLQRERRVAFSMARGKKSGVSDIESEAKLQDLETLLNEMVGAGEKVFHVSLNILLRATDEAVLDAQVSQALLKLRELSGAEGMQETLAAFEVFSELAIPNAKAKERMKKMKTSYLSNFLPLYGPWVGHEVPRVLLRSREGSLVGFDPFSKDLSNYNQIVAGGSGSGKSFLTNLILLQMLKENPKVFIVDIGGSYKKLSNNLSGQYVPFNLSGSLSINPFDLGADEKTPSNEKIKFLVGLIEMMTKEDGEDRLGRLERAEIEEAIASLYRESSTPNLSRLREKFLRHEMPEISRLGKILAPWCGDTPFGKLVDRKTTLELEKNIVSFDLKGLEAQPDLQAVCLYIITDFVWREVQRDKSRMKFLVFDECWRLLENEAGSQFIGEVFRTFRKYFASAIAISQNIDDFAKSKVASAILTNTSIKWILMQKGADQKRLQEVLQLNDNEMGLIASLRQERGVYSESFLIVEDRHTVVSVEPTSLEYWIATTDPRDLASFDQTLKVSPGKSQIEILTGLSEEFPCGVVAKASNQEGDIQ